jgi:hypothetical protein
MIIHKEMAAGRWLEFSLAEQLANVGMDIDRTIRWRNRGDLEASRQAFERALELITLTILDPKHKGARLRELTRVREALLDYFVADNQYGSSDELWQNYFLDFNYLAAIRRGK